MSPAGGQDGMQKRLPPWFKIRLTVNERSAAVERLVKNGNLHTVCQSASCPNQSECWSRGTATFMILGNICTRRCGFCGIPTGKPFRIDAEEPVRVAAAVESLRLQYAVITSVTRDDLHDGGASVFAETVDAIRSRNPMCKIEVLIPDFQGSETALTTVLSVRPDVLNHNMETVPSLYPVVRPQGDYLRSLDLLRKAKNRGTATKTGLMLGLGEGMNEIISVMEDLRRADCDMLTMGQYLQPSHEHLPVQRYYTPVEFDLLRERALSLGFDAVASGPLVRSSYHAEQYSL
jgi:lipoic acid synthetase